MEQAIKKSIEGGYEPCEFTPYAEVKLLRKGSHWSAQWLWCSNAEGESCGSELTKIFIDPLFWQCLGKAMGWRKRDSAWAAYNQFRCEGEEWKFYWHEFIWHLSKGKDHESFFTNLIK